MITTSSFLTLAQKPSANSTDRLLESGRAAKVSTPATTPTEIKIVSYNIRWRSGDDLVHLCGRTDADAPSHTSLGVAGRRCHAARR